MNKHTIHILVGPTAGGKSARAVELARALNGVVINADSMQIYTDLPLLTAQPSAEEKSLAEHKLYGILHPNDPCSAGKWRALAAAAIEETFAQNKTPIVVGGTGLYIKALMEGLSVMPQTPPDIRAAIMKKYETLGNPAFYEEFKKHDPEMAARFHPNHSARLIRAWEVLEHTGRSLADWQREAKDAPPAHWNFNVEKIMPDRETLMRRCDQRFDRMIAAGALDEARAFNARIESGEIDENTLLGKALGYAPLRDYLHNQITLEAAIERAKTDTRSYAKRQVTWFKNQL